MADLADQERKLKEKYGALPPRKSVLGHRLKERKYFDSGDYAMSKAGKGGPDTAVGSAHPTPDMIPHSHPPASPHASASSTSPAKESSLVKEVPPPSGGADFSPPSPRHRFCSRVPLHARAASSPPSFRVN
ncbi:hypothetical protein H9P43_006022 [Blastocladiella emersonii ATCC 22665]|nr:hypothetical protein H9P43_006022 [Blastocladiella emersonii ATCC 22665]